MHTYKLIPQLRENCVIEGREEWLSEFSKGDIIFLITKTPLKKMSIISKIEDMIEGDESVIYIDERILETLSRNDKVYIVKYNPAEALEIQISISDEYRIITSGEWTPAIKPSLLNKVVDIGQEITFLVAWEAGAPIVVTGIIHSTLPNSPVFIGERTRLYIHKVANKDLSFMKKEMLNLKIARVDIIEKQVQVEIIQKLREIKYENYPNKGIKYTFKATNPKYLFKAVSNIFKGFAIVEEANEKEYDAENQDYLASVVFLINDLSQAFQIIDVEIIATKHSGILILWVTAKDEHIISQIIEKYDAKIRALKQGLEQRVEIVNVNCPECGGSLPVMDIDIMGIVECKYCGKISKVPKLLRY